MTGGREAGPLAPFLAGPGHVVLDGGLATELEARGCDLADPLWSARALLEAPEVVREVHRAFLAAGADVIATATYQASLPGLARRGLGKAAIEETFRAAVRLAAEVRDAFWRELPRKEGRLRPLVAGSAGPYAAWLADGSEYRGDPGIARADLDAFHRRRLALLAEGADLLACETIPWRSEVDVLLELLADTPDVAAWISFSCRDGERLRDGSPVEAAAAACDAVPAVIAVGVNCVSPSRVLPLIEALRRGTSKPLLAYPNSGEGWDAEEKRWTGGAEASDWEALVPAWREAGAVGVGGCCRTRPADVARIRAALDAAAGPRLRRPGCR